MQKSGLVVPPSYRGARYPGQVPTPARVKGIKAAPAFKASMLLDYTEPVLRIEAITKGLGFDPVRENSWNDYLDDQINGGTNELVMRQALLARMLDEQMEPEMRKAIFQRSMTYYRDKMSKSLVQVVTPDEILEKAEARGGTYHRRIAKKSGKGFDYVYNSEQYATREDAHLSGTEARDNRITKAVGSLLEENKDKGCTTDQMKALAKKYGPIELAGVLKKQCGDGGSMEYKKGKFSAKKLEKSLDQMRPDFRFVLKGG